MYPTMSFANQESIADVVSKLSHSEAVTRLAGNFAAMAALDRQIDLCTDPRAESCLQTLRVEHEVDYLEALYGWAYEPSGSALLQ
jgi:hypothetical protein